MSTVCPPDHKHAESGVCYVKHRCRCEECRAARAAAERRRHRLIAYGRYDNGLVDAAPAREHLLQLRAFGMGYATIAKAAGVGTTVTRTLLYGREDYQNGVQGPRHGEVKKRISRANAEAILAVKPDIENMAGGALIPARGVHRRLQALVARGWSQSKLAERIGIHPTNFTALMQRGLVKVSTHREVAALFEELWDQLPPHTQWHDAAAFTRTLGFAKARRWLPPMAWDDIDNDVEPPVLDQVDGIDEGAVVLAIQGEPIRLTPGDRREAVTRLHAARWSDTRIAERLRCADRTVLRIRQELGLAAFEYADLVKGSAA